MFIPQTIEDYLDNPMGKGSSVISERKLVKDALTEKYNKLIDIHKKFKYTVYATKGRNIYFHFIIPSENERGNDYDVVLYFSFGNDPLGLQNDLRKAELSLFCNSPSFVFTYAYVCEQNGMYVKPLKKKLAPEVFELPPENTNPYKIISWEKHIFFALTYMMKNRHLLNRASCIGQAKRYNEKEFFSTIRRDIDILKEIKVFDEKKKKEKIDAKRKLDMEKLKTARNKQRAKDPHIKTGVSHITPTGKIKPTKSTRKK